jgi:hypothetical protein
MGPVGADSAMPARAKRAGAGGAGEGVQLAKLLMRKG